MLMHYSSWKCLWYTPYSSQSPEDAFGAHVLLFPCGWRLVDTSMTVVCKNLCSNSVCLLALLSAWYICISLLDSAITVYVICFFSIKCLVFGMWSHDDRLNCSVYNLTISSSSRPIPGIFVVFSCLVVILTNWFCDTLYLFFNFITVELSLLWLMICMYSFHENILDFLVLWNIENSLLLLVHVSFSGGPILWVLNYYL